MMVKHMPDLMTAQVYGPAGTRVGVVRQEKALVTTKFTLSDCTGQPVLLIRRKIFENDFSLLGVDGKLVGQIKLRFNMGLMTNSNTFEANFPVDTRIDVKALILAAVFQLQYLEDLNGKRR